jgi:tetratricopeptide (TPR) repeat protein
MIEKDWYRRNTWTLDDKQDFFLHFKRAKKHNKAQYLSIQARYLEETGRHDAVLGALELIELLLSEYPDPILLENAYSQKAKCLEFLNRLDDAIESHRLACQSRRNTPRIRGSAPLYFGMFVVRNSQTNLYGEIQAIFNEFLNENDIIFPYAKYMYFATNAIIADEYGQVEIAQMCAEKALQAASMNNSGFRRHPTVGLVEKRDKVVEKRLLKILKPGFLSMLKRTILR